MHFLKPDDFKEPLNTEIAGLVGKSEYILASDLRPFLLLAADRIVMQLGNFVVEKPAANKVSVADSFFSNSFSCPAPENKTSCTCCKGIIGLAALGAKIPESIEKKAVINGQETFFKVAKGNCPLFSDNRCSLGGSAEKFYSSVPLPCAISPGWAISASGATVTLGRKRCAHGLASPYTKEKMDADLLILARIKKFLASMKLSTALIEKIEQGLESRRQSL
jgi:hypothetical protein